MFLKKIFGVDQFLDQGPYFWSAVVATVLTLLFYAFVAITRRVPVGDGNRWNPLVISVGVFGRTSLAQLQIFFFSLIVFWVLAYVLSLLGKLTAPSSDLLYLLGISAAGTAGAKMIAVSRQRLTFENWAWLKRKGWIKEDIGRARRPPRWGDLISSDDTFDVFKFQNVVMTVILGGAIMMAAHGIQIGSGNSVNAFANFKIEPSLLTLMGLSQAGYVVGGKAVGASPVLELDKALTELRKLEDAFTAEVGKAWAAVAPPTLDDAAGKEAAPKEHAAYMAAANTAMEMLTERIGCRHVTARVAPDLPA